MQNIGNGQAVDRFFHNMTQSEADHLEAVISSYGQWGAECTAADVTAGQLFRVAPSGIGQLTITHKLIGPFVARVGSVIISPSLVILLGPERAV